MDLLQTLGHALNPKNGIDISAAKDMSFKATKTSLTATYRKQLATINGSVVINAMALLGMLNSEQLAKVVNQHKAVWSQPYKNGTMVLDGITLGPKGYVLSFGKKEFTLRELKTADLLDLMEVLERVLEGE